MEYDISDEKYFENRELSWLMFNQRILNEARDRKLPIMERMKFLIQHYFGIENE